MKKDKSKEKKGKKRLHTRNAATRTTDQKNDQLLTRALENVGGKWKLRILLSLSGKDSLRYSELRNRIAGITDMMLSQSLKELCAAGLTERQQFQQIPPRVEYRITSKADGALKAAALLCDWASHL